MPDIRSVSELARHVSGSGMLLTETNIKKLLKQEAKRLEGYLKEEINNYYASYTPKVYVRTYNWINSIRVSIPETVGNEIRIRIYFDDSMAYHPSVISSSQPDGYVPWVMNTGWNIEGKVGFHAQMFTIHAGTGYIDHAIEKYNANNPYGFKVTVETGYGTYI